MRWGRLILRFFQPGTRQVVENVALPLSALICLLPTTVVDFANCTVEWELACTYWRFTNYFGSGTWWELRQYLLSEVGVSHMRTGSCPPFFHFHTGLGDGRCFTVNERRSASVALASGRCGLKCWLPSHLPQSSALFLSLTVLMCTMAVTVSITQSLP